MLNKVIVATLSASLLFGGTMQGSAEASSNETQSFSKVFYFSSEGSWDFSQDKLTNLLERYFPNVEYDWDKNIKEKQPKEEKPEEKTQPEAEKEKTPEPKPEPKPETEQETVPAPEQNNEQDTVKEQPKAEQPEAPVQEQQPTKQQEQSNNEQSQQLNAFEQEVVELTNKERTARGLEPLKVDTELSKVAREKSRDMAVNNYFAHNSPTYGSPFDMMKQYGIDYRTAGENIAKGQRTPEQVVNGWMNSQGHRENILNPNFTHIGVGYVEDGNHWTQQFIGK